jgi:hypothetical protein
VRVLFPAQAWAHVAKTTARRVMAEPMATEVVIMLAAEMLAVEKLLNEMMMARGVAEGEVGWRDEQ